MRRFRDLAIVLKRKDFGESDRIITVFSKSHGKLRILAKGSRKIKSKLAGHIEPLSLVKISVVSGKSFDILTEGQIEKSFYKLKEDFKKLPLMNYICEVTDFTTCEKLSNPQIFNLLLKVLSSKLWLKNQEVLAMIFLLNLLNFLGYKPHLQNCLKCQSEKLQNIYFSYYWGGVLCEDCEDSNAQRKIDKKVLDILKLLQKESIVLENTEHSHEYLLKNIDKSLRRKVFNIISDFFIFLNDRKPNSLKFLKQSF